MTAARGSCFHCGEPIPAGFVLHARIAERDEPVCCHGCRAVAEFIAGAGLGDYYVYRDASAARADEAPRPDRWAAYDRPELAERLSRGNPDGTRSITVLLEGLRCAACSWLADKALRQQRGLREATVNPATARATLTWDPGEARLGDLVDAGERLAERERRGAVEVAHPRLDRPSRGREVGQPHPVLQGAAADLGLLYGLGVDQDIDRHDPRAVLAHLHGDGRVDRARAEQERERERDDPEDQ